MFKINKCGIEYYVLQVNRNYHFKIFNKTAGEK